VGGSVVCVADVDGRVREDEDVGVGVVVFRGGMDEMGGGWRISLLVVVVVVVVVVMVHRRRDGWR
jgi:hypothetical protein